MRAIIFSGVYDICLTASTIQSDVCGISKMMRTHQILSYVITYHSSVLFGD